MLLSGIKERRHGLSFSHRSLYSLSATQSQSRASGQTNNLRYVHMFWTLGVWAERNDGSLSEQTRHWSIYSQEKYAQKIRPKSQPNRLITRPTGRRESALLCLGSTEAALSRVHGGLPSPVSPRLPAALEGSARVAVRCRVTKILRQFLTFFSAAAVAAVQEMTRLAEEFCLCSGRNGWSTVFQNVESKKSW